MIEITPNTKKKSRIVVQRGKEFLALRVENIAIIYTECKVVFVIDNTEKKYLCTHKLNELEEELDPAMFFRANRQFIININYIKSFKPLDKVKLLIDLTLPLLKLKIIISQVTAPYFKKWIYEET
jgi:DNA-binding LytR/AlgR family response regulator